MNMTIEAESLQEVPSNDSNPTPKKIAFRAKINEVRTLNPDINSWMLHFEQPTKISDASGSVIVKCPEGITPKAGQTYELYADNSFALLDE